jgi:O-methyltransferase/methyltransferase family protein
MISATDQVMELIFGRWRSQILYAGTELGIFDHLATASPTKAEVLAAQLHVDPALLYRLLRAQAAIGLLAEDGSEAFVLTDRGALLRADHPQSLKSMARLEEGPQHYALWKHLPTMLRDGKQNAFVREFGCMAFDYALQDGDYAERFTHAMSSYSAVQSTLALEALHGCDFSGIRTFCDVAGGHGHLMCALLQAYTHLSGIVLDLAEVVEDAQELWAPKLGLDDRCTYVAGDMFDQVPSADAYSLKMILHDWNDAECVEILSSLRRASSGRARVFIIEHIVPGHEVSHFSKLFDIHMMCWGTGKERTEDQYVRLLERAGCTLATTHYPRNRLIGVIEGFCS